MGNGETATCSCVNTGGVSYKGDEYQSAVVSVVTEVDWMVFGAILLCCLLAGLLVLLVPVSAHIQGLIAGGAAGGALEEKENFQTQNLIIGQSLMSEKSQISMTQIDVGAVACNFADASATATALT